MNEHERSGRAILLVCLFLVLLVSIGVTALYVSIRGDERLPSQIVRFALTMLLCFYLYRGHVAAKWIAVILFCLAGGMATTQIWSDSPLVVFFGGVMALFYLSVAWLLLWSRRVNAFLDYQRMRYS